ncbi:MAG: hypothetical protein ACOX8W_02500 [bacterium]
MLSEADKVRISEMINRLIELSKDGREAEVQEILASDAYKTLIEDVAARLQLMALKGVNANE